MSNTRTFGTPGSTARSPDPAASQASKTDSGGSSLFGASNPNSIDIKQHIEDIQQKLNYVYDNYLGGSSTEGGSYTSILSNPDGTAGSSSIINNHNNYIVNKGADETGLKYGDEKEKEEGNRLPLLAMLNNIDWSRVKVNPRLDATSIVTNIIYTKSEFPYLTVNGYQGSQPTRQYQILRLKDRSPDMASYNVSPSTRYFYADWFDDRFKTDLIAALGAHEITSVSAKMYLNDTDRERYRNMGWDLGAYEYACYDYPGCFRPDELHPWDPEDGPLLLPTLKAAQIVGNGIYLNGNDPMASLLPGMGVSARRVMGITETLNTGIGVQEIGQSYREYPLNYVADLGRYGNMYDPPFIYLEYNYETLRYVNSSIHGSMWGGTIEPDMGGGRTTNVPRVKFGSTVTIYGYQDTSVPPDMFGKRIFPNEYDEVSSTKQKAVALEVYGDVHVVHGDLIVEGRIYGKDPNTGYTVVLHN